jgi:hypothetical protein
MPVSAYLKAGLFVVAAAAALFAAAGTVAIASFWAYLAIFAVVMIVSFAALDPDLLRELPRMTSLFRSVNCRRDVPLSLNTFPAPIGAYQKVSTISREGQVAHLRR